MVELERDMTVGDRQGPSTMPFLGLTEQWGTREKLTLVSCAVSHMEPLVPGSKVLSTCNLELRVLGARHKQQSKALVCG
jgi:hypothetical protein